MEQVIIRDMEFKDIVAIKAIVGDTWEWKGEFIQHDDTFHAALGMYMNPIFNKSAFGKVAVYQNQVVGMIFASVKGEIPKYRMLQDDGFETTIALLNATETERLNIKEYMAKIANTYQELIAGKEHLYDGCLEFFAVSKEARGLNIGKSLLQELLAYFKARNVASFYLYSDTTCNYGFYEHNGFTLKKEQEMNCEYSFGKDTIQVFLYDYQCTN